jgi:hypothetical protein
MRTAWICLLTAGFSIAFICGCGGRGGNLPELVPVQGTVTLDGKPLTGAEVAFIPAGDTRGSGATGYTKEDGKYELAAPKGVKGAPAGDYKVVITKRVMPDGSDFPPGSQVGPMDSPARQILPPQYSAPEQTKLTAKVTKWGGPIDFALK